MLNIILLGGEKDKNWSEAAVEKIINSINSCQSLKQLMTCRALVNN
jgi:3-deoxy-D-arabino-heptulosonate 7-phosphate (DAHP) synthase